MGLYYECSLNNDCMPILSVIYYLSGSATDMNCFDNFKTRSPWPVMLSWKGRKLEGQMSGRRWKCLGEFPAVYPRGIPEKCRVFDTRL